jgi:putative endonuclease
MYYVYILKSKKTEELYTGTTNNLNKRIAQHNDKQSYYTAWAGPYVLVWYCAFLDKQMAYNFETYLKSSSGFAFRNKRLIKNKLKDESYR